mmetsp:Transcript_13044/g.52027  ORF Transcript_13044/g.52027 Transcript_13044/m.52027 type:complete len:338 (-) Transcript_13044:2033-3046(-)
MRKDMANLGSGDGRDSSPQPRRCLAAIGPVVPAASVPAGRALEAAVNPGLGGSLSQPEACGHLVLGQRLASGVMRTQPGIGVVLGGHDFQRDLDPGALAGDVERLVQLGVQLLLMAADDLGGGLDQGVERGRVQRLGVLLVAAHGPGADQGRLAFTGLEHRHGPALVVFVLDDLGGPALVAPESGFVQGGVVEVGRHGQWAEPATKKRAEARHCRGDAVAVSGARCGRRCDRCHAGRDGRCAGDAGLAASGDQHHRLAAAEALAALGLDDGAALAVAQLHDDFQCLFLGGRALDRVADDRTRDSTQHADHLAFAPATDRATGDRADRATGHGADAAL